MRLTIDMIERSTLRVIRRYQRDLAFAGLYIAGAGLIAKPATAIRALAIWELAGRCWISERIW